MNRIWIILALALALVSCNPEPKKGYVIITEGEDNVCQVDGHSKDYHASIYDYAAGQKLTYDVIDGSIVAYGTQQTCTCHSFEVWRCAVCGNFFKVFKHSYTDGHCTVCGDAEK